MAKRSDRIYDATPELVFEALRRAVAAGGYEIQGEDAVRNILWFSWKRKRFSGVALSNDEGKTTLSLTPSAGYAGDLHQQVVSELTTVTSQGVTRAAEDSVTVTRQVPEPRELRLPDADAQDADVGVSTREDKRARKAATREWRGLLDRLGSGDVSVLPGLPEVESRAAPEARDRKKRTETAFGQLWLRLLGDDRRSDADDDELLGTVAGHLGIDVDDFLRSNSGTQYFVIKRIAENERLRQQEAAEEERLQRRAELQLEGFSPYQAEVLSLLEPGDYAIVLTGAAPDAKDSDLAKHLYSTFGTEEATTVVKRVRHIEPQLIVRDHGFISDGFIV